MDRQRKATKRFSTDDVAVLLRRSLIEDFRPYISTDYYDALVKTSTTNVIEWRSALRAPEMSDDPFTFKVKAQLANLYKKYTFVKDMYTPQEVTQMSIDKFMENQRRLASFSLDNSYLVLSSVIMWAKGWIANVLLDYDEEEHLNLCAFAKKSTVGVSLEKANLAERYQVPITGSAAHISWFQNVYLSWNGSAINYLRSQTGGDLNAAFREIDCLDAVLVPKTFKSRRMIMANTTIGSLYSDGLGKVITKRLARVGYDIASLQQTHGTLAKFGSKTGKLVTADQSLASDNITVELIDRLLPARWASALKLGRISKISLSGTIVESKTFSTMGIGFTFPLQTLVFLALLKGISLEFFNKELEVSAYGDDLIYDSRLHPFVARLFPQFGLLLNTDKTYSTGSFRESCGHDYFHGVDVRPFQLGEVDSNYLSRRNYEAFLYTIINGLLRRWSQYEIPVTLTMLGLHLKSVGIRAYVVPNDYPDTCGVKIVNPNNLPSFLVDCRDPVGIGNGLIRFKYLRFIADRRIEHRHEPYLWNRLQQLSAVCESDGEHPKRSLGSSAYHTLVRDLSVTFFEEVSDNQPSNYRSKLTGRRLRKRDCYISIQRRGRYREQTGSSSFWT